MLQFESLADSTSPRDSIPIWKMISPSSSSLLLPPPPPPLTLPTVATTNSTLEVLQEGWYFILINKLTLYECWYQVFSDGTLVFRMNTDIIYKFAISNIHFKLFDASSSLPTGCGLMLSYNSQDYYFIFDHILDMKRFCFSCYRTAEGTNLQVR